MNERPVSIRPVTASDVPTVVAFLRQMLADMATVGGYPVAKDAAQWTSMQTEFLEDLHTPSHLHLLAETGEAPPRTVGWAFARTKERDPVFEPAHVLHISAVYVAPHYRRRGIGRTLLKAVLEWGRSSGCVEAELSVLVDNPARSLYREFGFSEFEIEMTREL
jgi:ribosomal protein S18 acetylase RimI-like enzyme